MGVFVSGRSELAGTSSGGAETGANAGGLRGAARRQPTAAGLSAQPGRESKRLGRTAAGSVPARAGRQESAADCDRWLSWSGGGHSHRLSAGAASALLGTQDAQYSGEGPEVRL